MGKLWTFGDSFTAGFGCKIDPSTGKNTRYYKLFSNYYDNNKPIWPEILANSLNMELNNEAQSGYTNEKILDRIMINYNNIQPEDFVIIQSSTSARFDFPFIKKRSLFGIFETERDSLYNTNNPYGLKTIFNANITEDYEKINPLFLTYTNSEEDIGNEEMRLSKEKYDIIRGFFIDFVITGKYYEREMWRLVGIANIIKTITNNVFIINEDTWPNYLKKPDFLIGMGEYVSMQQLMQRTGKTIKHETNGVINDYHPGFTGHVAIAEKILSHFENINLYNT